MELKYINILFINKKQFLINIIFADEQCDQLKKNADKCPILMALFNRN